MKVNVKKHNHPLINRISPIKVILMDDDIGALNWYRQLLLLDPRTTVLGAANSPKQFLSILSKNPNIDVAILDVEYISSIQIKSLLDKIKSLSVNSHVLCYSQYGDSSEIRSTLQSGISGFLLKNEINIAIATSVALSIRGLSIFTPTIAGKVMDDRIELDQTQCRTILWTPPSELTPALKEAMDLCILYGMSAKLAGLEIYKSHKTMETYVRDSYNRLKSTRKTGKGLKSIIWDKLKREEKALILYTQPKVRGGLVRNQIMRNSKRPFAFRKSRLGGRNEKGYSRIDHRR